MQRELNLLVRQRELRDPALQRELRSYARDGGVRHHCGWEGRCSKSPSTAMPRMLLCRSLLLAALLSKGLAGDARNLLCSGDSVLNGGGGCGALLRCYSLEVECWLRVGRWLEAHSWEIVLKARCWKSYCSAKLGVYCAHLAGVLSDCGAGVSEGYSAVREFSMGVSMLEGLLSGGSCSGGGAGCREC